MNDSEKIRVPLLRLERYVWALAVVWTMVVATSLVWNVFHMKEMTLMEARIQADIAYKKDILSRYWNASHGGVYVPVTEKTQPNPYLSHVAEREIRTPSGKLLTLINPAYMTRQLHELAKQEYGVRGHITSLNPIRPENAPDPWETDALRAFERKETETSSVVEIEGKEYLRLMRPLITEKACLKCHAKQGYKEGDVRGGISVGVLMEPLLTIERRHILSFTLAHSLLWLVGMGGIVLGVGRLRRGEQKRRQAEEALQNALMESRRRQTEISALLRGSRAVLESREFQEGARSIFDSCKNLIGATGGYLALLSEDGARNEPLFLDSGGLPCSVDPSLPMPIRGVREEAYRTGEAVYHNEFSKSEGARFMPEGHASLVNVLFAPLRIEGKTIGLLGLANKPGGFTENDARLASAFGELAAIALLNSRTLESLANSEERFRSVAQSASDAIISFDSRGGIIFWNQAAETMFGYSAKEALGQPFIELMPERFRESHPEGLWGAVPIAESKPIGKAIEWVGLSKEGKEFPVELSWATWRTREGTFFTVIVRDTTERKRTEEDLRRHRQHLEELVQERTAELQLERNNLKGILDTMNDGVYIVNPQYHIEYINPVIEREFGPVEGRKCYEYFHDRKEVCPWCKNQEVFAGRSVQWEWSSFKTGKTYELFDTPIRNADGIVSKLELFHDITERKHLEEELRRNHDTQNAVNSLLGLSLEDITLGDLLKQILELILSIPWLAFQSRGSIHLVEDEPEVLVMKAQNGLAEPIQEACARIPFGRCLCGRAALTKKIQFADCCDDRHEIRYEGMDSHGHYCVPILSGSSVAGVINIYLQEGHRRDAKEEEFLTAIANTLAGIIERKWAQDALRESEKRFRSLVTATAQVVWTTNGQGELVDDNPAWRALTGQREEEIKGWGWANALHPEDRQRTATIWSHAVETGTLYDTEYRVRRYDGEYRYLAVRGVPVLEEDGRIREWVGTCTDITSRRQAEDALQQSETRYRAVVEQSADAIYLIDVESKRILEANPAFAQMLGYSSEEILGLSLYDFIAADREDIDWRFQNFLREGRFSFERQYRRKDGSLLDVWVTGSLISYGRKQVRCVIVRDLTEKKAMEAHLLRAQRMESIGLLAGGIAHDLNNILAPILINAELLQREVSEQGQRLLSSIASCAQRGADIVKQILTFARGMEGERISVSPRYVLKEMESMAKETFPKDIETETDIPRDLWSLSGDPTQLHQVLLNLCVNARDAMPQGGKLVLSAANITFDETYARMHLEAKPGPYVLLSVSDTGCGISPQHLDRIFDPFFTTKERGKGTGMGLATVHGIVKSHGGFVEVTSQLGKGTTFEVYLPATPAAKMARAEEEKAPLPAGKGELILLAEDESAIREGTQEALEAYGYQVMAAADGAEALSFYAQHRGEIHVVLIDLVMPIMDGLTMIRVLQRMDPSVKVIATSGMDQGQSATEVGRGCVKAFLQKPFTAEKLLRTLREILDQA